MSDCTGMTLRDWFAGQALSSGVLEKEAAPAAFTGQYAEKYIAERAYKLADAMLKARQEKENE
jgi:hypothetical protein